MKLMTYNVRVGIETSIGEVVEAIRAAGVPDLLALQEIGVDWNMGERIDQPAAIAEGLGLEHHAFAGALTDDRGGQFGVALVSRWPIREHRVEWLPRETDEQRVCLVCTLDEVSAVVTHLSVNESERRLQAAQVAAAASVSGPVVVMGDLNDRPGTATIDLARGGLTDCFDAVGVGDPVTFSVKDPHRRIDYLFCGGGLLPRGEARVVRAATASDHFPLVCEVG